MMSSIPGWVRKKRKTQEFYWKLKLKATHLWKFEGPERWGGICLTHTWQLNQTNYRGSPKAPHHCHPFTLQTQEEEVFLFMWESFMATPVGRVTLSWENTLPFKFLRTKRHMWKERSVPGSQGIKSLLLKLGQSSLLWKPLSSFSFGELSCVLTKPSWIRSTLPFRSGCAVKCINNLS